MGQLGKPYSISSDRLKDTLSFFGFKSYKHIFQILSRGIYYNNEDMNNLAFIFWVTLVLYVLLETDAIPKWGKFLEFKFLKYEEYEEKRKVFEDMKYKTFLSTFYPNFFVQLVSCQECLCVWLNIIGFSLFSNFLGGWPWFALTTLGSLIAIAGLNYILKKLYE